MPALKATFRSRIEARLVAPETYHFSGEHYRPVSLQLQESQRERLLVIQVRLELEKDIAAAVPIDLEALRGLAAGDPPSSLLRATATYGRAQGMIRRELRLDEKTEDFEDGLRIRRESPTFKYVFDSGFSVDENIKGFREFLEKALEAEARHRVREVESIRAAIERVSNTDPEIEAIRSDARQYVASLLEDGNRQHSVARLWLVAYYFLSISAFFGLMWVVGSNIGYLAILQHFLMSSLWALYVVVAVEVLKRILARAQRHHSIYRINILGALGMIESLKDLNTGSREKYEAKKSEVEQGVKTGVAGCQQSTNILGLYPDVADVGIAAFGKMMAMKSASDPTSRPQ